MSVLVLAEVDNGTLSPATARIVAAASQLGPVDLRRMESNEPAALGAGNPAIQTRPDGSKWVKVFYATDRDPTSSPRSPPSTPRRWCCSDRSGRSRAS